MSRYQHLTLEELEAEEAALQCALEARRAMDTLLMIDGPLPAPPEQANGEEG